MYYDKFIPNNKSYFIIPVGPSKKKPLIKSGFLYQTYIQINLLLLAG